MFGNDWFARHLENSYLIFTFWEVFFASPANSDFYLCLLPLHFVLSPCISLIRSRAVVAFVIHLFFLLDCIK